MNLLNSILRLVEGNISDKNEMNYIQKKEESEKNVKSNISMLIKNKNYQYKSLREELKMSPLTTNCYDMINEEVDGGFDDKGRPINPKGDKISLLQENSLLGQQILIVMLWSCALSDIENKLLDPKNIEHPNEKNPKCIRSIVDHLGVKVKTVLNYENAIKELTKKDKNGKCNYYTVWVMCGPEIKKLPDSSKYPGLVEQFIDCLLLYWQNGGAVVLFCDNDPLYFQANIFLEKIRFQGEIKETKLRIEGNDLGTKVLRGVKANGNLKGASTYDTTTIKLKNGTERMPLGRNVPNIYEGETISHANSNNKEDIKPFIPFAKNSSGNFCIMVYYTQGTEGDIIIDCGYTKAFINMGKDDDATWRYIQNITGFLARPEVHMNYDGETAKNYRPEGINYKINYTNLYTKFKSNFGKGELDIVYMIDSTGSMSGWILGVKNKCNEILDKLINDNPKLKNYDIKCGGVFYRDPVDKPEEDKHEHQPLDDVSCLKTTMESIKAKGGGDTPEDWVGAYRIVLDEKMMNWREKSIKIIIHIADAGAHSLRFSDCDSKHNSKEYEKELENLIQNCAKKCITIFGFQITDEPKKSFTECEKIYNEVKSENSEYQISQFNELKDEGIIAEKLKENVTNRISAFIAKKNN